MADQLAQVKEMFLHGLFFTRRGTFPFADEILRSHVHGKNFLKKADDWNEDIIVCETKNVICEPNERNTLTG